MARGLGKGLDALFGGAPIETSIEQTNEVLENKENLNNNPLLFALKYL